MIRNDIPMPEISESFTIDDIHKIREWNYERMKNADYLEIIAYYKSVSIAADREREALREKA